MTQGVVTPNGVIGISPHALTRATEMALKPQKVHTLLTNPHTIEPTRNGAPNHYMFRRGNLGAVIVYTDQFPGLDANVKTFVWTTSEAWDRWFRKDPDTTRRPRKEMA